MVVCGLVLDNATKYPAVILTVWVTQLNRQIVMSGTARVSPTRCLEFPTSLTRQNYQFHGSSTIILKIGVKHFFTNNQGSGAQNVQSEAQSIETSFQNTNMKW